MTLSARDQQKLEQLIQRVCSDLPMPRAPAALRAQVLGEIQRQAARPWWQKPFGHWPLAVRLLFILLTAALAAGTLKLATQFAANLSQLAPLRPISWLQRTASMAVDLDNAMNHVGASLLHSLPGTWLYAGLISVAATYAVLLGIGVTLYRTIQTTRWPPHLDTSNS